HLREAVQVGPLSDARFAAWLAAWPSGGDALEPAIAVNLQVSPRLDSAYPAAAAANAVCLQVPAAYLPDDPGAAAREPAAQADLLRDLSGNPFRLLPLDAAWR